MMKNLIFSCPEKGRKMTNRDPWRQVDSPHVFGNFHSMFTASPCFHWATSAPPSSCSWLGFPSCPCPSKLRSLSSKSTGPAGTRLTRCGAASRYFPGPSCPPATRQEWHWSSSQATCWLWLNWGHKYSALITPSIVVMLRSVPNTSLWTTVLSRSSCSGLRWLSRKSPPFPCYSVDKY